MTQWLLSGHNTQETTGMALPATATMSEYGLDLQFDFMLEKLGGPLSQFDRTVKATQSVQGKLYLNMEYFARNMSAVVPFDPASLGVPAQMVKNLRRPSLGQQLVLGPRFYRLYAWSAKFYKQTLPTLEREQRALHQRLRNGDLSAVWMLFNEDLYTRSRDTDRAHVVDSLIVVSLDSVIRQQAPGILPLFAGQATVTSQIAQRIWELRELAMTCGPEVVRLLQSGTLALDAYQTLPAAKPLVDGVEAFLKEYGHRGFRHEVDFETERLFDHPEHILLAIGSQLGELESPHVRAERARQNGEAALNKLNPLARMFWRWILKWAQQLIAWREASKSNLALRQAVYGQAMRLLAKHFYPNQPNDILMLYTFEEFMDFVRSEGKQQIPADVIAARRAQHTLHTTQTPPPELIWYEPETGKWSPVGEETRSVLPATATQLNGIPASAGGGPVEGIALVTNSPIEAGQRLLQIDGPVILITRLTDPAWSSLFARLTAVITELGGVVSHAAIVARENGLPAVVGVADATRLIRNGQRLRVDGGTGTIDILDS